MKTRKVAMTAEDMRNDDLLYEKYLRKCISKAQGAGVSIVTDLFISMLDPKNRGEKFTWEGFEQMAVRHAGVMCYHYFDEKEYFKYEHLIQEDVKNSATWAVKNVFYRSGILEWQQVPIVPECENKGV